MRWGLRRRNLPIVSISTGRRVRELHRSRGNVHDVELVRERLDDDPGVVEVAGDQTLAQRRARDLQSACAKVGDRWDRRDLNLLFRSGFHGPKQAVLARLGERNGGSAAAGAIGLINSFGNVGGFVGPYLIGFLKETTGSYTSGWLYMAFSLTCAGLLILTFRKHVPTDDVK